MIPFLILLALSPILIPIFALACIFIGAIAGLWIGTFLLIGIYQIFLDGWK